MSHGRLRGATPSSGIRSAQSQQYARACITWNGVASIAALCVDGRRAFGCVVHVAVCVQTFWPFPPESIWESGLIRQFEALLHEILVRKGVGSNPTVDTTFLTFCTTPPVSSSPHAKSTSPRPLGPHQQHARAFRRPPDTSCARCAGKRPQTLRLVVRLTPLPRLHSHTAGEAQCRSRSPAGNCRGLEPLAGAGTTGQGRRQMSHNRRIRAVDSVVRSCNARRVWRDVSHTR